MTKAFIPKWVAWFTLVIAILVIMFGYYETFCTHTQNVSSFIFSTVIMVFVAGVIFYVSYYNIPYLVLQGVSK